MSYLTWDPQINMRILNYLMGESNFKLSEYCPAKAENISKDNFTGWAMDL